MMHSLVLMLESRGIKGRDRDRLHCKCVSSVAIQCLLFLCIIFVYVAIMIQVPRTYCLRICRNNFTKPASVVQLGKLQVQCCDLFLTSRESQA